MVLSLATGARQGEIMSLHWRDVDLKRGVIILHETKNDERRSVPLTGHALNTIRLSFPGYSLGRVVGNKLTFVSPS